MPIISTYDWSGIPGIITAAPTIQCFDVAYAEQLLLTQWHIELVREREDVTMPWAYKQARVNWDRNKPWWARY